MTKFLDWLFGERLARETSRYLEQLTSASRRTARRNADELMASLAETKGPKIQLGTTDWQTRVEIPFSEIIQAYGLITGGTGAGKSRVGLLIIDKLIDENL